MMVYKLHDLEITVIGEELSFNCAHKSGDKLLVKGENISFGRGTTHFSHYVLAALMPFIAAKQRPLDINDWMYFESDVACPDPKCGAIFRFTRKAETTYSYSPIG